MPAFSPQCLIPALEAFPNASRYWIAYSGGMDSEVLLHAIASLRGLLRMDLCAIHVDHGLHADSVSWAEHCRRRCGNLGVPLTIRHLALQPIRGESLEALAREARYGALRECVAAGELLLTAQHRDDQAETLLLALMRGSGIKGLAAMPAVAPFGEAWLLRPLLDRSRRDLLDYAGEEGLTWVEDPSNGNLAFDRNFLRARILPLLAERWPSCAVSLARTAGHCAEAQGLIDRVAGQVFEQARGARPGSVSVTRLSACRPPLVRATLRFWIAELGLPPPDSTHLERIRAEVLGAAPDRSPLVSWKGCEIRRYRDEVFAMPPLPPRPRTTTFAWEQGALELPKGLGRLYLTNDAGAMLDPDAIRSHGLEVRFAVVGFSCRPGLRARNRRLKHLFQEACIPPWLRPYVPYLFADEQLVAVGDLWRCAHASAKTDPPYRVHWEEGVRTHAGFGRGDESVTVQKPHSSL